jgi:hypothetical protein
LAWDYRHYFCATETRENGRKRAQEARKEERLGTDGQGAKSDMFAFGGQGDIRTILDAEENMAWLHDSEMVFKKTGAQIKEMAKQRITELEQRLSKRNAQLDQVMNDKKLLRSYLVREPENDWPHTSQRRHETPSEEHQEITELCRRICTIESDLVQLRMIVTHMDDDKEFDLGFDDMVKYGFPAE